MLFNYIVNIVLSNATLTQSYIYDCVYIEIIDFFSSFHISLRATLHFLS